VVEKWRYSKLIQHFYEIEFGFKCDAQFGKIASALGESLARPISGLIFLTSVMAPL
jgi:hypothetical protein